MVRALSKFTKELGSLTPPRSTLGPLPSFDVFGVSQGDQPEGEGTTCMSVDPPPTVCPTREDKGKGKAQPNPANPPLNSHWEKMRMYRHDTLTKAKTVVIGCMKREA